VTLQRFNPNETDSDVFVGGTVGNLVTPKACGSVPDAQHPTRTPPKKRSTRMSLAPKDVEFSAKATEHTLLHSGPIGPLNSVCIDAQARVPLLNRTDSRVDRPQRPPHRIAVLCQGPFEQPL